MAVFAEPLALRPYNRRENASSNQLLLTQHRVRKQLITGKVKYVAKNFERDNFFEIL